MISSEQMVDLADFTLNYLSSNREYRLILIRKKSYLQLRKEFEEQGLRDGDRGCRLEHGEKATKDVLSGKLHVPCFVKGNNIFIIERTFSRMSVYEQMMSVIHEARHITELPRVPTDQEAADIDHILLRQYARESSHYRYPSSKCKEIYRELKVVPLQIVTIKSHCAGITMMSEEEFT